MKICISIMQSEGYAYIHARMLNGQTKQQKSMLLRFIFRQRFC